jgi:hypothetical protein
MSTRDSSLSCRPLLRRSVELLWLYRRAAATCEPGLRLVLEENAQTLAALIADLRASPLASGPRWKQLPAICGGALRRHAMVGLMHAAGDRDGAWIALVARREAVLLHAFEHAAQGAPAATAHLLGRQLRRLRALYRDMHCLTATTGG